MAVVFLVPQPSVAEEARKDAAKIVADLQALLDAGDIAEMHIIVKHPDGTWSSHRTSTTSSPDMIGRLEVAKFAAVKNYLES